MPWSDITALRGQPFIGVADEASKAVPETRLIRFEPVAGQSLKLGVISAVTGGGFRDDGVGGNLFTATVTPRLFATSPLEKIAKLDKASNMGLAPEELAARMQAQAAIQLNSMSVDMARALYYKEGTYGPNGLYDIMAAGNQITASGASGTVKSIWFVNAPSLSYGIGNGGQLDMPEISEETVTDNGGGSYRAWVQAITARATVIMRDSRGVAVIFYQANHLFDLDDMYAAMALQNDMVPFTHIFMLRSAQSTLRTLQKAEQTAMYVTLPTEFEGIPIVTTPNIPDIALGSGS
jgi:hypothetical protein